MFKVLHLRAGAAVLLSSAALAACGESEPSHETPSEPPAALLAQALADPAPSGVATVGIDLNLEGDSLVAGANSVSLHGPFELDQAGGLPRFAFDMDADVAGFGVDGALVATGGDAYVVFFGENYRVGADRVAAIGRQLESGPQAQAGAGGLGLEIDRWFEDPRYTGIDDVAGTETERIEGTLNSAAVARDLGALARSLGAPASLQALGAGAGSGPASAWVAYEDKTIRRINVQFPFTVPPAERAAANGISGGTVSLDAQISNVGEEQQIEPPAGGGFQPIDRLVERLGDLASLGGL